MFSFFEDNNLSSFSVFRAFRILRILKIVKRWHKLQALIQTITMTIRDLRNFMVLLFIAIFAYTLLGLELFAYKIKFNDKDHFDLVNGVSPRVNFDGFLNAFAAVFNIL